jgi:hypothetical protein
MVRCGEGKQGRILLFGVVSVLVVILLVAPSAGRSPTIKDIQSSDLIFVYERNLDLSALHGNSGTVVSSLRHYSDFTAGAVDNTIFIGDENAYTVLAAEVGGVYGPYYAWNASGLIDDGTGGTHRYYYVDIQEPAVALDVVLAAPNHVYSVEGLTISQTTPLAFKVTAPRVGSGYHAGDLYPAQVSIVLRGPEGAERTLIGGVNHVGLNVSATQFYTDDPGRVGYFDLSTQDAGTYSFQAKWTNPPEFADEAMDSNIVTFSIRGNPTDTAPTTAPTQSPTMTVTTAMTTPAETGTTTVPTTAPSTTTTMTTVPPTVPSTTTTTAAPLPVGCVLVALGAAGYLALKKRG